MNKLLITLCFVFVGVVASAQIDDPSYKSKVVELIDIQSATQLVMDNMVEQISVSIPEENKVEFKKDMDGIINKMIDKIADIYMENYTKEEVDALMDFYNTPVGKSIQNKLPEMIIKSQMVGESLTPEVMIIMQKYM